MQGADVRAKEKHRGGARGRQEVRSMGALLKALLAGGAVFFGLMIGAARGDDATAAIARLLEVGWSITPQARLAADAQYEEVARLAGKDVRALEAAWLVLMQQRRFDDALDRIEEHLAREPGDLAAL